MAEASSLCAPALESPQAHPKREQPEEQRREPEEHRGRDQQDARVDVGLAALPEQRVRMEHDDAAAAAAELGILFCIVATVSGSLWAKAMWGSYWNWDPRETSIFFLLLIYSAYLALRSAIEGEERRARLAAIYSAAAFVAVPFLMFVVPRIYDTLHPSPILPSREAGSMDPRIRTVFLAMLVGFSALFFWLLSLRVRFARVERRRLEAAFAA